MRARLQKGANAAVQDLLHQWNDVEGNNLLQQKAAMDTELQRLEAASAAWNNSVKARALRETQERESLLARQVQALRAEAVRLKTARGDQEGQRQAVLTGLGTDASALAEQYRQREADVKALVANHSALLDEVARLDRQNKRMREEVKHLQPVEAKLKEQQEEAAQLVNETALASMEVKQSLGVLYGPSSAQLKAARKKEQLEKQALEDDRKAKTSRLYQLEARLTIAQQEVKAMKKDIQAWRDQRDATANEARVARRLAREDVRLQRQVAGLAAKLRQGRSVIRSLRDRLRTAAAAAAALGPGEAVALQGA